MLVLDQVHLMHECEDMGFGRVFLESFNHSVVSIKIAEILAVAAVEFSRFYVKYVDQNSDGFEYY